MAGQVIVNQVQLGNDPTATKNLVITTNADGTFKIARGNVGATTQDILTINSSGRIVMPQSAVAFRGTPNAATTFSSANVAVKVEMSVEVFDYGGYYDAPNSRFTPLVPGLYMFTYRMQYAGTSGGTTELRKNGALWEYATYRAVNEANPLNVGCSLVNLNGTTDYVEMWGAASVTGMTSGSNSQANAFAGFLVEGT